jgi:integrase
MESILKKLQDAISPSSFKQYSGIFKILNIKSVDDLKETDRIMTAIDAKKSANTQKNYLAGVVKLMRIAEMDDNYIKPFFERMNEKITETKPSPEYNDKQRANLMSLKQIEEKRVDLIKGLNTFTSRENYDRLLNHLILSLYTMTPPRRNLDYFKMEIAKNPSEIEDGKNYLLWTRKAKQFVFQEYKTSKKYGKEVVPVPEGLTYVIDFYLKHREKIALSSKQFLTKYGDLEMENSNEITRRLNSVLGKQIGASMLRHIYLTETLGDTVAKMEEIAMDMGHSVSQQRDYIKK